VSKNFKKNEKKVKKVASDSGVKKKHCKAD
jgi:hypothetical protein